MKSASRRVPSSVEEHRCAFGMHLERVWGSGSHLMEVGSCEGAGPLCSKQSSCRHRLSCLKAS